MIIAVIICLIAIIFIMLDTIKKIKPEEQPKDKAEFSDIQIKTEENIYEQYKIKEDSKKYNEDGIMQIQLQFSKDLFDDEYISNEEYFEALIEDFVKIHKTDFELVDNKKKIKIQVKATSENNYDYTLYIDRVKSRKITIGRNSLEKLKEDIENGKFSKILITNLTNVSRDTNFNLELISFAEDNKCKIVSMDKFDPHQYKSFIDNVLKKIKEERER